MENQRRRKKTATKQGKNREWNKTKLQKETETKWDETKVQSDENESNVKREKKKCNHDDLYYVQTTRASGVSGGGSNAHTNEP